MIPTQIEAAELVQALASGTVDAFVSSGSTGYDRKVWEHLSNFYDTQAWLPRNYIFVNKSAFNALDDQEQACLRSSALLAEEAGTNRARYLSGWYLAQLAANGMEVAPPGDTLKADLDRIGQTMSSEWSSNAGEEGAAILSTFRAKN